MLFNTITPKPKKGTAGHNTAEWRRNYINAKQKAEAAAARDIAPLPEVADPQRRESCRLNLRLFLETYFPETFTLKWSADHLKVIAKMEQVVLHGGRFALAMPRGAGKTSLVIRGGSIWGTVYGHRRYCVLVGATESMADKMANTVKSILRYNDRLCADFPEICVPVRKLEGMAARARGQTCNGEHTNIVWEANRVVLPRVAGSDAAEAVIETAGITGQIRGRNFTTHDGRVVRPEIVLIDDPQTKESARSAEQTKARIEIILQDIAGLAGMTTQIAMLMPCTVIEKDDLADEMLDRKRHPDWNGERMKALYHDPDNGEMWNEYRAIREKELQESGTYIQATEFYRKNQLMMDAGAVVAWQEAVRPPDISALQSLMNYRFDAPAAFASEMQNEPLTAETDKEQLQVADVARRVNHRPRRSVPTECATVSAFIDVQKTMLFYVVTAWSEDFTGYVIDYGSFPDQKTRRFTLADARRTFATEYSGRSYEGALFAGLTDLLALIDREYRRDDGAEMRLDKVMIDAGYGYSTPTVTKFCRESQWKKLCLPSFGRFVGARNTAFEEWKKKPGEKAGLNCIVTRGKDNKYWHVKYDTNFWKSLIAERLRLPIGERGALTLYGDHAEEHRRFAEHICAETFTAVTAHGRRVEEWTAKPGLDNHWLDCLVGSAVAANLAGVKVAEAQRAQRLTAAQLPPIPQAVAQTATTPEPKKKSRWENFKV